jgi:hypothetical protein
MKRYGSQPFVHLKRESSMPRLQTVVASIDLKNIDSTQSEEDHAVVVSVSLRRPQQTQTATEVSMTPPGQFRRIA